MSRIAYLDCTFGASGDMLLGALVDLGLPLSHLETELRKLPLEEYRLETRRVLRAGLSATKLDVVVDGETVQHVAFEGVRHEHGHDHPHGDDHDHAHAHGRAHAHEPGHVHRGLREIEDLLTRSALEPAIRERCLELFRRLADAEAAVHGTTPDDVHFHEVGAVDSIVDIVGGVVGLRWLNVDRVVASPLNVGSGTVRMSHGTWPVPAPATARLLRGAPIYGEGEGELLTPTGALLVTGHADRYGPLPPMRPEVIGYGAGSREVPGRPNVLRILVGSEEALAGTERVLVVEAEVDDMSPQLFPPLVERLLEKGALDVFGTPILMKKGRPGLLISLLCAPEQRGDVEEILFAETTTLGVRFQEWQRSVLGREVLSVETAYGPIGVKIGSRGGRVVNAQPEFEDCRRAAEVSGAPVKEVIAEAVAVYRARRAEPR
jgi:pyridinium-3,5-bisthiocarboxylic acid mononucleotide nickel chelatase